MFAISILSSSFYDPYILSSLQIQGLQGLLLDKENVNKKIW